MASPSEPSPTPSQEEDEDDGASSGLSDPPSNLSSSSMFVNQTQPRQVSPTPVPKGYRINSITGDLMVDPKSRDSVTNFRKIYHPDVDFSSGRYINESAYAVSLRHVPPNVPTLGPRTKGDDERYRGPPSTRKRAEDAVKQREDSAFEEHAFVKAEPTPGSKLEYPFHEDENWEANLAATPMGKGKKADSGEDVNAKEDDEGDTTLTDPPLLATPPVKNFRIG
ncbi:hypothetical protein PRZ48_003203 [Zasmidium cellare]|uniref:Uncharacterized protein n=1 Tax=Zasmidium cellare TaxID=395010 RepID=A0ABR0EVE8_ZASCE|nr:hypothetical protein PRZ48_003203 [Zasmidium cellare]